MFVFAFLQDKKEKKKEKNNQTNQPNKQNSLPNSCWQTFKDFSLLHQHVVLDSFNF